MVDALRQAPTSDGGHHPDLGPATFRDPRFELESAEALAEGAEELEGRGYSLLHPARTEPWGQTVGRILTVEGVIVGLSFAPWLHDSTA